MVQNWTKMTISFWWMRKVIQNVFTFITLHEFVQFFVPVKILPRSHSSFVVSPFLRGVWKLNQKFIKLMKTQCTVWKFQDFSVTWILREVNFEDSRSAKSALLTHSELWILIFMNSCTLKAVKHQINKIQSTENNKNGCFQTSLNYKWQKNPRIFTLWNVWLHIIESMYSFSKIIIQSC